MNAEMAKHLMYGFRKNLITVGQVYDTSRLMPGVLRVVGNVNGIHDCARAGMRVRLFSKAACNYQATSYHWCNACSVCYIFSLFMPLSNMSHRVWTFV